MVSNTTSSSQGASLSQFFTTLAVAAAIATIQITIFILIRTKCRRIYEPKTFIGDKHQRTQSLPKTCFGWLPALLRVSQDDIIRTAGLDAYFFSRYIYIHAFFFLGAFVLLGAILFPIYTINGKGETFNKTGLDLLTFGNISPNYSSRYVAPLVLAYAFIGAFIFLLYRELRFFVNKRQTILRSSTYQTKMSAQTILVTAIPKRYMSHRVLYRIFNQFPGGVKYIWLNRDLENLPDKAQERSKFVEKLETIECKLIRNILKSKSSIQKRPTMRTGSIPFVGQKVDAITYYKEQISQLNNEIERAKSNLNSYKVLNSAFIQFHKPIAAHMAVQTVISSMPSTMTPRYNDIKPKNIIWSNLKLTYYEKRFRELIVLILTILLIIFWSIPVTFVGILSNLTYLTDKVTFLSFIYDLPTPLLGLITGLLPTVLLAILMALLPIILKFLARLSGVPTTNAIELYVQSSYFLFQVVQVFLVVTISSSITSVITKIIQQPPQAPTILATNIPTASNFFFSFLALQGLNMTASLLLQIVTLILFPLLSKLFDNTPRKKWRRYSTLTTFSWGFTYPVFTNFIVITLVYSVIAPLILLITGLVFLLCYIAYAYQIFYVSNFPDDTGGLLFPRAIYQSFTGLYLMEIMLAGLFFLAQDQHGSQTAIPQGISMCVLIGITVVIHVGMQSNFHSLVYNLSADAEELSTVNRPHFIDVTTQSETTADELHEYRMKTAYMHPAIRDLNPIIWIAEDELGIAAEELQRSQMSELNIMMSTRGAYFNEKMRIKIEESPPDQLELTDLNV